MLFVALIGRFSARKLGLPSVLGELTLGMIMGSLAIGIGMLPRGEVGLIFAAIGKEFGVVNDALFSSPVLVVVITTLLAPPLLKITLRRHAAAT